MTNFNYPNSEYPTAFFPNVAFVKKEVLEGIDSENALQIINDNIRFNDGVQISLPSDRIDHIEFHENRIEVWDRGSGGRDESMVIYKEIA